MKYANRSRMNTLSSLMALGAIHANSGVAFAGVPMNLATPNFQQQGQPAAPMSGHYVPPALPSAMVPGVPAAGNPDPNAPAPNPNNPQGPSPLEKYKEFFDNTPKPTATNQPAPAPTVLDAGVTHYAKSAEKLDFSSLITPEQRAAMAKGGEAAAGAFIDALNTVGRQVYAHSGATASSVVKKGIELSQSEIDSKMQQSLTLAQATSNISQTNSILTNPMYKPMVSAIQQHFLTVKPTLSPTELAELTVGYFNQMATAPAAPAPDPKKEDPTGLGKFFEF